MIARVLSLACLLLVAACGLSDNVVILMPDENGGVGRAMVRNADRSVELNRPYAAVETQPGEPLGAVSAAKKAEVEAVFAGALAATPPAPVTYAIYFLNDEATLDGKSRVELGTAIAAARTMPNVDISVSGHADAVGADAYNLPLSQRRAETVRDALVAAGIPPEVIELTYHGSNNPRVPNRPGASEPLNRRVEITIR
jgi:peptidoglycan-associated lipoprotein